MSRKAFARIAEGLNEVLAIARGEAKPAKLEIDVRAIRRKLGFSQEDFAALFGFTLNQIKDWEKGRSRPLGGVRAYLMLIATKPQAVVALLQSIRGRRKAA
jgi:putative transcriptional regulator